MSSQINTLNKTKLPIPRRKKKVVSVKQPGESIKLTLVQGKVNKEKEQNCIPLLAKRIYSTENKLHILQQQLHEALKIAKKRDEEIAKIIAQSMSDKGAPMAVGFLGPLKNSVKLEITKQIKEGKGKTLKTKQNVPERGEQGLGKVQGEIQLSKHEKCIGNDLDKRFSEEKVLRNIQEKSDRKGNKIRGKHLEAGNEYRRESEQSPIKWQGKESKKSFHKVSSSDQVHAKENKQELGQKHIIVKPSQPITKETLTALRKSNNAEFTRLLRCIQKGGLTKEKQKQIDMRLAALEKQFRLLLYLASKMQQNLEGQGLVSSENEEVDTGAYGREILKSYSVCSPNFDNIIMVIQQMNAMIGDYHVVYTQYGATFQKYDYLTLVFYENGMTLDDFPFREYSSVSAKEFFCDLGDGYYPNELKHRYPEGVLFQVFDKRKEKYTERTSKTKVFCGVGYRLGGKEQVTNIHKDNTAARNIEQIRNKIFICDKRQNVANTNEFSSELLTIKAPLWHDSVPLLHNEDDTRITFLTKTNGSVEHIIGDCRHKFEPQDLFKNNPDSFYKHCLGGKHLMRTIANDQLECNQAVNEFEAMEYIPSCKKAKNTKMGTNVVNIISNKNSSQVNSQNILIKNEQLKSTPSWIASSDNINQLGLSLPLMVQLNIKHSEDQIALKIRSNEGHHIFLVYLYPDDTVKKLRSLLIFKKPYRILFPHQRNNESSSFELTHDDLELKGYGINKNTSLTIINKLI